MKRALLLSVLMGALPLSMAAQDDLYFTPSKKDVKKAVVAAAEQEQPTYYIGSDRDVDEYNRRVKQSGYYQLVEDTLGKDTLFLFPSDDVIAYDNDDEFTYSRRMGRFDGFYGWYDPWFYGYWGSPWYRHWGWDPWYTGYGWGWGGYYGWYDPWYYGYGWGYPYRYWGGYWGRPAVIIGGHHGGYAGTRNHSFGNRGGFPKGNFGGSRNGTFGNGRGTTGTRTAGTRNSGGNRNFGGARTRSNTPATRSTSTTRSNSSFGTFGGSNHSGGSFGGSRGGGFGGGGGSRGGGGGHFGGGRR